MLAEAGETIDGQRIAVSGAGNVAVHVAEKAQSLGGIVTTLSNRHGTLLKEDGLSADDIQTVKQRYDGDFSGDKPWSTECDIAVPAATQNELDESDAAALIDAGCKYVLEAANMPLTDTAEETFDDAGIVIAPGKAANAGGVVVSGFEITQNRLGRSWSSRKLDKELRKTMTRIFERTRECGDGDGRVNYRRGADIGGFHRVAQAVLSFGVM